MLTMITIVVAAASVAAASSTTTAVQQYPTFYWTPSVSGQTDTAGPGDNCPKLSSNTSVSTTGVFLEEATACSKNPTTAVTPVTLTDDPESSNQIEPERRPRFSAERRPSFSADYLWILVENAGPKFWFFIASGLVCSILFISFVYLLFSRERRTKMEHTIDGVSQKSTVDRRFVNGKLILIIQIHAASSGMTPKIQSKFLKFYEATYGACIVLGDGNMTWKKCGLNPEQVATELKCLTEFTVFASTLNINKCRGLNPLWNAQNNKGQKQGPENVDSDGMVVMVHHSLIDLIDIKKMEECVKNETICPVTSLGISPWDARPSGAYAFDEKDSRVICDHSFITILLVDGSSLGIGSGASLYGRCDNAQKPGAAEIVEWFGEQVFTDLGNKYRKNILHEWNELFAFASGYIPEIAEWNYVGPNEDGDETWRKQIIPVNKLFSKDLKMFKSDEKLKAKVELFIENMILHQQEVIDEYTSNFPDFATSQLEKLSEKYEDAIWKYIRNGRFDKLLNYQLIALEGNGGFCGTLQTDELYTQQHTDALGENTILYLVESDALHHRSYYQDLGINDVTVCSGGKCHSYLTKTDNCSELELLPVTFLEHFTDTFDYFLKSISKNFQPVQRSKSST